MKTHNLGITSQDTTGAVSAEMVSKYLLQNPEFFREHDDLLAKLDLPHQHGESVSLVERQMSVLRKKNTELRHRLDQLVSIASSNDQIFTKCRDLTLSLLDVSSDQLFFSSLQTKILDDFSCDAVSLLLISSEEASPHPLVKKVSLQELAAVIPTFVDSHKSILGTIRESERQFLFSNERVSSVAAVPLIDEELIGLLAVGSFEPNHFSVDLDTMFLEFIAEVITKLMPRFT